jgi:hypothetical protein
MKHACNANNSICSNDSIVVDNTTTTAEAACSEILGLIQPDVGSNDSMVVNDTTTAVKAAGRVISSLVRPEMRDFYRLIN